ncbi:uncharacterized protein LOC131529984 isoform X2 [Onychostoma macrolepis]|uniref:uncharacterized protein LOC131529984 isoform X2 n=1 Tax=Onychostoma macrolepis TaxID=369639 RepID=UPI002729BF9F|nr:uncharacterized protein LOC131529984 isoform X2 [Onychostoma macrolepis]XP_058616033.1 uncharacterized protein LOC131529984 isoform X2 [Onychostoma macrolepis]XP_058616034.1 uncharacterized protein LOC131529984 isoform X2 [Onychostoma macrolepis]XP_058616035.1 uncharacterized protein LOC131529984 isoform X2 [Onychostoma macrolepis]
MTSVSIRECDDYDMTSHVEEEEEEDEEAVRRKKSKRNFDDYVLESEDLEEEEENMTDAIIKVPSFPIPPSKVTKSIQMESAGFNRKFTGTKLWTLKFIQVSPDRCWVQGQVNRQPWAFKCIRASQMKGAGSSHQSSHSDVSQYSGGSHHSKRYRHRKQSRHSDWSRDSNQMQQDYEIDQTPISRYSGRSFSEQSNRSSAHESSHTGPRRETDLRFPMDTAKFQKKVLSKLVDIHMEVRRLGSSWRRWRTSRERRNASRTSKPLSPWCKELEGKMFGKGLCPQNS